jgi:hypothetical protein
LSISRGSSGEWNVKIIIIGMRLANISRHPVEKRIGQRLERVAEELQSLIKN